MIRKSHILKKHFQSAEDLRALPAVPAGLSHVWISGEMAGLEQAPLPPSWRALARMAYPVDLPGQRVVRVDYALGWFRIRRIPVVAPRVQVDTYLACGLVSETLNHMVDAFVRDYLIERIEMALRRIGVRTRGRPPIRRVARSSSGLQASASRTCAR